MTRSVVLVAAAFIALSCSGSPSQPDRARAVVPATPGEWVVELDPRLERVVLTATATQIIVLAQRRVQGHLVNVIVAVDTEDGGVLWEKELTPHTSGEPLEGVIVEDDVVLVEDDRTLRALDRSRGKERWRYTPADGGTIFETRSAGGRVLFSVDNKLLVTLDSATGEHVAAHTLDDDPLEAVWEADGQLVAATIAVEPGKEPQLVASRIEPTPKEQPPQPLDPLWTVSISTWSYDVQHVGEVLVGSFRDRELWAIEVATGKVLWQVPLGSLSGPPVFGKRYVMMASSNATREGWDSPVLAVEAFAPTSPPEKSDAAWQLHIPTGRRLLGIEPVGDGDLAFGATGDRLFVFDASDGRLVWTFAVGPRDPGRWRNATASNGAAYVYYAPASAGRGGVLRRIPIVAEE